MFKKTVAFTIILCTLLSSLTACNDNRENDFSDTTILEQPTLIETEETTTAQTSEITSIETVETTNAETEEFTSVETVETTNAETEEITNVETVETTSAETEEITSAEIEESTNVEVEEITSAEIEETTNSNSEESTAPELIDSLSIDYKHMFQNKHNFALGGQGVKEPTSIFIGQYKHPNSDKYLYEYDTVEYAIVDTFTLLIKDGDGNILMMENFNALVSTDMYGYVNTNLYEWHKVSIEKYVIHEDTEKYSQKYPNVEIEYEKILDTYFDIVISRRYGGYDRDSLEEIYPDIPKDHLKAIDIAVSTSNFGYKLLSYATKDLNNDGVSELFLIDCNYHIYALMSITNGEPWIVYSDTATYHDSPCYIDENSTIYTAGASKGECWQKNVLTLNEDGKLCGYTFGHYDLTGFGDDDVYNYYYEYDAEHPYNSDSYALYKRLNDEEFEELNSQSIHFNPVNNLYKSTRDAGLTVYQVITYFDGK